MAAAANDFAGGGGEVVEISSSSESEAASDVAACNNAVALIKHRILLSAAGHIADTAIPAVVAHSSLHARSKSRSETPPAPKQRRAALPPSPTAAGVSGGLAGECCQMHTTPYLVV